MKVADALSRYLVQSREQDAVFDDIEGVARAYATSQADDIESVTWRRVSETASVDEECVALVRLITEGFPEDRNQLPKKLQKYWGMKD